MALEVALTKGIIVARKLKDPQPGDSLGYGNGSLTWVKGKPGLMEYKYPFEHNGVKGRGKARGYSWAEVNGKRRDHLDSLSTGLVADGTVAAMCEAWLADRRRSKGTTLAFQTEQGYLRQIRHITAHVGDMPAVELDEVRVWTMLVDLAASEDNPLGRRTIEQIRDALSTICKWGIKRHWLTVNPALDVEIPDAATKPKDRRWFTLDEYSAVRDYLIADHTTAHTMYLVMLLCGLRPGEARGLRWDAIDFDKGALRVESAMRTDRNGKLGPSSTLKTDRHGDAARRTIPMHPELIAVLRRERREQFARGITDYAFESVGKSTADTEAGRIAKGAGVRYVNPNGYRHTFASVCRHNHMPYEQLAKLMGHKTTRMVIQVYGHPLTEPDADDMLRYLGFGNT